MSRFYLDLKLPYGRHLDRVPLFEDLWSKVFNFTNSTQIYIIILKTAKWFQNTTSKVELSAYFYHFSKDIITKKSFSKEMKISKILFFLFYTYFKHGQR